VLDQLPLKGHGKLDRIALAKLDSRPGGGASGEFVPPRNFAERRLAEIWADLLERDEVGIKSNFFDLGGHSLLAGRVLARVANVFGVSLPIRALFEASTVEALALRIEEAQVAAMPRPELPDAGRDHVPCMSILQEQVVRIERELPGLPQYNLPFAFRLRGPLNVAALELGLMELVGRHESSRTCFKWTQEGPVPSIASASETMSSLDVEDLSMAAPAGDKRAKALLLKKAELRVAQEAWTSFDLERAPLLRARLLRLRPDEYVLVLIVHHVIVDGWSMGILFEELAELYSAFAAAEDGRLGAPGPAFSRFAAWQRRWCTTETAARQLAYWKDCLHDASPVFAVDFGEAGELLCSRTAHEAFHLPAELITAVVTLSHSEGATLFMALMAGFKAMLLARAGRGDICVGTTMANRSEQWVERIVGPVENTTVIRTRIETHLPFREILRRVRHSTLEAHARQDFPFEMLVAELAEAGQPDLASLVQVFFVFQNAIPKPFELPGIAVQSFGDTSLQGQPVLPVDGARLTVTLQETPSGIGGSCVYKADLFKARTVRSWLADYVTILIRATAEPDKPCHLLIDRPRTDCRPSVERNAEPAKRSKPKTTVN
jgi:acyl carrier protein